MNANLNNIPLFQFPPSIEFELEARGYASGTHAAPMHQAHHSSYQHCDDSSAFLARRSSTSMIPQVARSQQPSHQFSNAPVRHYSSPLSAADVHGLQSATFRHPNGTQARPPIPSSPFGASHPNRAGTSSTTTFAPQPQSSVMQQTVEHAREQQQRGMMYVSPSSMASTEGTYYDHGMVKQEDVMTGISSDASTATYTASQYPAKPAPRDERAPQFDVYVQDVYEGTMQSPRLRGNIIHDSSPSIVPSEQYGTVKQEAMDDSSMTWANNFVYMSPVDGGPSPFLPDHAQPSVHPAQTHEFEQKSFETSQLQDTWDYAQHQPLYIDTAPITPQEYAIPYGAVDAYGYVDSPMSVSHHDSHFDPRSSCSPGPSLHTIAPPPSSKNRSYTLEGAVTPISPPHAPAPPPHTQPHSQNNNTRGSSPPMGSLRPPSRPTSESSVKAERSSSTVPPAAGSSASVFATPVVSPNAPAPTASPLAKRPRGRPRKNPPSTRPSSPPPTVDYPFPQFPDNSISTSLSTSPGHNGSGKGKALDFAGTEGVVPPIAGPVPIITTGTAGASGPMPGSSSSSKPRSHSHSDPPAAANGDPNATGKTSSSSNVPPGLTAGQGIFRLNMPREGEESAAEPTGEKKKPIMACLFCRERKIACGPPPPGGPKRCNQCTRRDLVCEYPKESRRGQHKRGPRAVRVDELAAASGSPPSAIKPKPSKRKASNIVRIDTVRPAQPVQNLVSETDGNGNALPFPPSPLTPLSSPLAPGPASGTSPLVERPSRSEKVTIAQPGEGKERSRSRSHARPGDVWGDLRSAAARRVVQMQQKKRTVGSGLVQAMSPQDGNMEVEVAYELGGDGSTGMGAAQTSSQLARAGMPPYGMGQ